MPDHVVAIQIGGREFTGWEEISIEMAIDQCADGFSLSSSYDPARPDLAATFKGAIYKPCVITIDGEPVLTGRVESVEAESSAEDRVIKVQGRSLTAPLVDCGIDGDLEFSGLTLAGVCKKVCGPFGISVRPDNDTDNIESATAQWGQSAFDFLNTLAAPHNFFLNSSYDGKLVLTAAASMVNRPVVASLREGEGLLKSVSTKNDGTKRFSVYKMATQFAGVPDGQIGEARDPTVTIYRPRLEVAGEINFKPAKSAAQALKAEKAEDFADDPDVTAARARTVAFASSFEAHAVVIGWRAPNGQRWHERQMVTLYAPGAMLSREMRYIIAGVTFKLSPSDGETVDMRLMLPELYAGGMPKVLPWD